ncbi:MAG: DegT/DnrJ/EryC1/StrS family aminotransferase [Cyclobacteriaceae bacterium]|nr:DegT/DnrJ/EryC1/StrS family aminotransferase [Cyclobacteriaceae bacterium]
MINVTRPYLPEKETFDRLVAGVWERNWLTNNGPLVNELELKIKEYLHIDHLLFVTNGTIALQIAIKALNLKGEIITTPFSYVATTSSIVWEGCEPVFVDIDPLTFNLDPSRLEEAITPRTTAILATHVFGNPCAIETIDEISNRYGLKVIYDNAHGFGVKYKRKSLFSYGDVSTASFHATKIFHTIEGGAVTTRNPELLKTLAFMRNFGHNGPDDFAMVGINGKNSELHAAMGLSILPDISQIIASRKRACEHYTERLKNLHISYQQINSEAEWNYSYFPILFLTEQSLLKAIKALNENCIYPRRYFYPSLSSLRYVKGKITPVADDISRRILCLPLYVGLSMEEIDFVARILLRCQNN